MKFKMIEQQEAMLSLTSEGLFANGLQPSNYRDYVENALFETVSLDGGTLYDFLSQLQGNDVLKRLFTGTRSYDYILNYLNYINWDKNRELYIKKFGESNKFKTLKISVQTYVENEVIHFDSRLICRGVTSNQDEKSLFGERLEEILDVPLEYDGLVSLKSGFSIFKPLLLGELINTLTSEVYCMTEGSPDVSKHLNYLPE